MLDNKEVISFFENFIKMFSVNEKGEVDIDKIDYHILENKTNSPEGEYLLKKLPEFFSRGCIDFKNLYEITGKLDENKDMSFDKMFFAKLVNGDLSDLYEFEKLYPYIQILAKFICPKLMSIDETVNKRVWKKNVLMPELLEKYPQYRELYDQVINHDGMVMYQNAYSNASVIEILLKDAPPEDVEMLNFALKVTNAWELSRSYEIFNERKLEELQYTIQSNKKSITEDNNELEELKRELELINKKLSKYNIITALIKKQEQKKDLENKDKIVKKIARLEKIVKEENIFVKNTEEKLKFIDIYRKHYSETLEKDVLPKIKELMAKTITNDQQEIIFKLIDSIFLNRNSSNVLYKAEDMLEPFLKDSYDDYLLKLNNAIITVLGMAQSVLKFEKQDDKSLFTLLDIAREELMKTPLDEDHGKLEKDYRKHNLSSISDFMDSTVDYRQIEESLTKLNGLFTEIMKEKDLDEYIKKVGILWYNFVRIHPFADGNGRVGRYIINILLAHQNIIIPALYNSQSEEYQFNSSFDNLVINRLHSDYDAMSELFLEKIQEIGVDLTGKNRLRQVNEEENEDEEYRGNSR